MVEADDGLKDYVGGRSPEAFRRVVDRYVDLVYAAARRQVRDPALAEDVTQAVFMVLAEKADGLHGDRPLSAWLLQVTWYAAANARRSRARQAHHERKAAEMAAATRTTTDPSSEASWEEWSPLLDEGISRLSGGDRDAIVLRFFEQKTSREVAESLGITEEAAAKRVERAVRKLREFFGRRGVTVSAGVLAATLAARSAAEAAPAGLGASVAGATSGVGTSVAMSSIAKGAIVSMATAKVKTVLVSVIVGALVAGVGGVAVVESLRPAEAAPAVAGNVAPARPASPWTVTFSDGSTADLIGVTNFPDSGVWWAADGTVTPTPPEAPPGPFNNVPMSDSVRGYQMVIRHNSPTVRDPFLTVSFPRQPYSVIGRSTLQSGPNAVAIDDAISLPKDLPAVDLVLIHASGPWQVAEHHDLRSAPAPGPDDTPNPALRVVSVKAQGKGVAVETASTGAAGPVNGGQFRMFVVSSADGQEHLSNQHAVKPDGGIIYSFPVRKDQAVALVKRWRPTETREIRNISLRPGTKTDVSGQQGETKK